MSTPKEIQVHTDKNGDKYISIEIIIYLPEDTNPESISVEECKTHIRNLERYYLQDMVLAELDKINKED